MKAYVIEDGIPISPDPVSMPHPALVCLDSMRVGQSVVLDRDDWRECELPVFACLGKDFKKVDLDDGTVRVWRAA